MEAARSSSSSSSDDDDSSTSSSSSSSDSSSSGTSSSGDNDEPQQNKPSSVMLSTRERAHNRRRIASLPPEKVLPSSEDDDESTAYSSSDQISNNDDGGEQAQKNRRYVDDDDDDDDDDVTTTNSSSESNNNDGDDDDETQELPLSERVRIQEKRGFVRTSKNKSERKARALQIATERLTRMKQHEKKNKANDAGDDDDGGTNTSRASINNSNNKKKKSKHAPAEVSSKRADFYLRNKQTMTLNDSGLGVDIGAHRYKPADPRVSNLHGHLNVGHFEHNYAFLQDLRNREIQQLRQRIAARKMTGKKGQKKRRELGLTTTTTTTGSISSSSSLEGDKAELKRLLQEKAEYERQQIDRAAKRTVKKNLQRQVAAGERGVYFPKRKELKRMHLEAKFEEIRKRGGDGAVDKAVAKRRKKNKSRDASKLGGRFAAEGGF